MRRTPRPATGSASTSKSTSIPRLLAALLLAGTALPAAGQAPPPDAEWRTIRTEHFRVTYEPELEPLAREAGDVAERAYAVLARELHEPPSGTIDILLSDHVGYTNGFAYQFPSNRIVLYARPPTAMPQLAYARDWLELVLVHELVHTFHLDEAGGFGSALRSVFGRIPMIWPIFPVSGSPTWNVEGLATYYESVLTGAGRIPGSFHDMIIRTAALETSIPDLEDVSAPHPAWPTGQRSYAYGSRLMEYITERFGPDAHRALIEATGGSWRPTFLFFDHVADDALGVPFDEIYEAWRDRATADARALAARMADAGPTTVTEPLTDDGPYVAMPRVSPDGRRLSYAAHDFRSDPATRVVDLGTGAVRTVARRNQFGGVLGPAAWLPDGSALVVAQLELRGPYRAYSDLWRVDLSGRETRLTDGLRLAQPDVAPDGRRVAAVQVDSGALSLVVHDLETGRTRTVVDAAPGDAFDSPRWSPDGTRIAVGHYSDGRVDIAVVDAASGRVRPITRDDALDLVPAWSPDGGWLVWWSDRSGIPQVLAARVDDVGAAGAEVAEPAGGQGAGTAGNAGTAGAEEPAVPGEPPAASPGPTPTLPVARQGTRLLTGAFDPAVSPDGRTLYLSVYHHDGWRIESMPFDPAAWPAAGDGARTYASGLLAPATGEAREAGGAPSSYAPWATLRPYFWLPEWVTISPAGGSLSFPGLSTRGQDLVGRHQWALSAGYDFSTRRVQGSAAWVYRGLGSLELQAGASRDWTFLADLPLEGGGYEAIYRRTDQVTLDALLWRARWRSRSWLRLGTEMEWRENQAHDMTAQELADRAGVRLVRLDPTIGVSGGPGFSNARYHPYSISAESGVSGSVSVGRWWNIRSGSTAYDEVVGRLAGYLDLPLWGFADHVLAARVAGLARRGDAAFTRAIGGVPGEPAGGLPDAFDGGAFLPVRGYDEGARRGTRAWTATGEWRFPLHLRPAPGGLFGLSLTAIAGAVFADVGDAWCSGAQLEAELFGCEPRPEDPLASAGAELLIDFGIMHSVPGRVRIGAAQPLAGGGGASLYLSFGAAF